MTKKRTPTGLLAALLLAALASLTACGGLANRATITLSEFHIKPKGVDAVVGKPITITVQNAGKIEHNLELDPTVSDVPLLAVLGPGESKTVTFTPKAAGAFRYVCAIPGHAPAGMAGMLTVGE
ncbi:MAG TPA: cupredoxin domain-containing protein [Chloroflexota bacterium]|jgi:uncharacterized cupredoxin-like copper-binding protein|nr:cupredoxin domain-containing protein [Chloroflexota bacterium]